MQQDSWTSNGIELMVRRKLAGLDETYNVFHVTIYTYIVFELLLWQYFPNDAFFKQKHLRVFIWEYI